jgi:HSP20 family molecular chaperone IbpA
VRSAAVEFRRLAVTRGGRHVLHEVDCSFAADRVTGLFRPSGSGKSTLIRAIAGVQTGVRGSLTVLDRAPGSAAVRRELGYMTQSPSVYEDLTGNLGYFADIRGGRIGSRFDRMFRELYGDAERTWTPEIDVVRDNGNLIVRADVPGIKPEEVTIEIEDDILTVSGEHEERTEHKDEHYLRRERRYGSFCRSMALPAGLTPRRSRRRLTMAWSK